MFPEVPVQVGLLSEAPVAEGAPVGLLLVVNVPHMALQVGRDGEGTLAAVAFVRLFTGVGSVITEKINEGNLCNSQISYSLVQHGLDM